MNVSILFDPSQQTLCFAAKELKSYLLQINSSLEISCQDTKEENQISLKVIETLIPDTISELDDAYTISIEQLSGSIIGSNPRSVLLGVYKYLYLLGCRFLRPQKKYEFIPSIEKPQNFTVSYQGIASVRHRGVCIEGADSYENIADFIAWLPKLGFNSYFIQFQIPYAFLNLWYQHTNNPLLAKQPFSMEYAKELSDKIDLEIQKRGLLHHRVGHGWTCEAVGQSALGWVEAKDSLSEENKSLLALVNGKRDYYCGIPINTNLCYSNPEVISRFTSSVVDYAKSHPEIHYLHVWLADDCNNHCECEPCQKSIPTDLYLHILNEIDAQLTRQNLPTKIVFLIYMELLWPPQKEKFINPNRFVLMFAPISRTFTKSYCDRDKLPPIPPYKRNQIKLPNDLEENLAFLKAWKECFSGDSFVYDYPLGRAHFGDPGYIAISKILYNDIQELKILDLNGYISCQEMRAFLPNALPNYVMGLSLFNSTLSFEEIAKDYYEHAYGENWKLCYDYLETLSSYHNCDYFNRIGDRINPNIAASMEKACQLLTDVQPVIQKNIETHSEMQALFWKYLAYHNTYAYLLSKAIYDLSSNNNHVSYSWKEFCEYIQSHESEYQECLDVYRIIQVGTVFTKFPSLT